jgi:hypothetical protein
MGNWEEGSLNTRKIMVDFLTTTSRLDEVRQENQSTVFQQCLH